GILCNPQCANLNRRHLLSIVCDSFQLMKTSVVGSSYVFTPKQFQRLTFRNRTVLIESLPRRIRRAWIRFRLSKVVVNHSNYGFLFANHPGFPQESRSECNVGSGLIVASQMLA